MTSPIRLSASAISEHLDCRARWYYGYRRRLPKREELYPANGSAVHTALAELYQSKLPGGQLIHLDTFVGVYEEEFGRVLALADRGNFANPDKLRADTIDALNIYYRDHQHLLRPLHVEEYVELEGNEHFPEDLKDSTPPFQLVGKIDLIDDRHRIIDHKLVGKVPATPATEGEEFQLVWYALLAQMKLGITATELRYDYIVRNSRTNTVVTVRIDITTEKMQRVQNLVVAVALEMRNSRVYPNPMSESCRRPPGPFTCPFWDQCHSDW